MEYLKNADYDYIMNKYHSQDKPFDPDRRFVRHDEIFCTDSGMAPDEILNGIMLQDELLKELPHPIRKARAFEYVLKNTRISCDSRDIFPSINMIDRPLNKTIIAVWNKEVFGQIIPEVEERRARLERDCVVTIWPDYDHTVPVWERILGLGFAGLLTESEKLRTRRENITQEHAAFFDAIKITYTAILQFIVRLEVQAKKQNNIRLAIALANIKEKAPGSFYEALLVNYLFFVLCEHIEGLQVRSLSNFDRVFYNYYKNDLANGVSEEQIRKDLAYFFLQFTAINNYWNQPVYLGGCKEDESTQINELSYVFLDVYDKMGIYNPKIQIKIADSTPKSFIFKALEMIRRGHNSIVFVSDNTIRKALEKAGFDSEQARLCDVKGCYEYSIQGAYGSTAMCYVNLLKPLEYALHAGCDGVTGKPGLLTGPKAEEIGSFDEFYWEYKKQLNGIMNEVIDIVNAFEVYLPLINPLSMCSATVPTSLIKAKDVIGGGATSNGSVMNFGFMADIADSLTIIKEYVFDRKKLTLAQLRDILDNNYGGNEILRRQFLRCRDKYGNNKEIPDYFANDIVNFACSKVCGRPNSKERGGKWTIGFHVARQSYDQAPMTAASPNGRRQGDELSKNLSASMGMNREGATAAILSVTKLDATSFTSDACLDLGILPSAVKGEDGLMAMYGLLMTFVKRGGHAMQINVFNAEDLRKAQKEPDKYKDLQIRVCGWNVLWNNISIEEQNGFIRQAEALV